MHIRRLFYGLLAGMTLGQASAVAQDEFCLNPLSIDLLGIQLARAPEVDNGVMIMINISDDFDPNSSILTQIPAGGGVLRLDSNDAHEFISPIRVPIGFSTRIRISVVSAPLRASRETYDIAIGILTDLASATSGVVFRRQPMIELLASTLLERLSDHVRAELERGEVIGQTNALAKQEAAFDNIASPHGVFHVWFKKNCGFNPS